MLNSFFVPLAQAAAKSTTENTTKVENAANEIISFLWDKIDNWIFGLVLIMGTFVAAKSARNMVVAKISEHLDEDQEDIQILAGRVSYIAVVSIGITAGLKVAGIDLTSIIAAVGFGVGFALRDLIMNFAAGIMILVSRQFNIGDYINVDGTIGRVIAVQSRCTILEALDGTKVIVPNSDIFSKQVVSYTTNTYRRIEVPVGVDYGTDLNLALRIALESMKKHKRILQEPEPVVILSEFADSSINLLCRFWVESKSNWLGTRSAVISQLKKDFDEVNINIPFPIRTLYFANELSQVSQAMEERGEVPKASVNPVELAADMLQNNKVQANDEAKELEKEKKIVSGLMSIDTDESIASDKYKPFTGEQSKEADIKEKKDVPKGENTKDTKQEKKNSNGENFLIENNKK